ncbi:MAG TPA: hypothetical protein VHY35_21420 [Stellaceae bacterium]|jgi:hypothetical protein|nr:hypothetical protein [Stellaceae bacterium]
MAESNAIKDASLMTAMLRGAETWANAQGEILASVETVWGEWAKRQREAADLSAHTLQRIGACRTPADLLRLQQQWLLGTVERAAADIDRMAKGSPLAQEALRTVTMPAQAAE